MIKEIRIENSTLCNYRCVMCPQDLITRPREIMNQENFELIIKNILLSVKPEYINFSGMGEPLSDKGLVDKIFYLTDMGMKSVVVTNGFLLTPRTFLELQAAGTHTVRISFHGTNKEEYEKNHGPNSSFDTVYDNYLTAMGLKSRTKIGIYCISKNVKEAKKIFSHADFLEVWKPHNWGNKFKLRRLQSEKRLCGRIPPQSLIQVLVNGDVCACCFDWNGTLVYGNLLEHTLYDILSSERAKVIIEKYYKNDKHIVCYKCDQRNTRNSSLLYTTKKSPERLNLTSTTFIPI